jgi:hypothetical protein
VKEEVVSWLSRPLRALAGLQRDRGRSRTWVGTSRMQSTISLLDIKWWRGNVDVPDAEGLRVIAAHSSLQTQGT